MSESGRSLSSTDMKYKIVNKKKSLKKAVSECKKMGGELAKTNTTSQKKALAKAVAKKAKKSKKTSKATYYLLAGKSKKTCTYGSPLQNKYIYTKCSTKTNPFIC